MADDGLMNPVEVQLSRLDATVLPPGISQPFMLYLIQQGQDFSKIAGKANEAGAGAYDAQQRNDAQDQSIENLEQRAASGEEKLEKQEQRISSVEQSLSSLSDRIAANEDDIGDLQQHATATDLAISNLTNDYVSKSATTSQTITSPININTSLSVNGTKVVGVRQTGFITATGTAHKGAFDASLYPIISATYTLSEQYAMRDALVLTRQRVKALEDAMRSHGLID